MEKNSDEIRVEIEDGKAKLYTPYNKDFIEKIKGFGGTEHGLLTKKCLTLPVKSCQMCTVITIKLKM